MLIAEQNLLSDDQVIFILLDQLGAVDRAGSTCSKLVTSTIYTGRISLLHNT